MWRRSILLAALAALTMPVWAAPMTTLRIEVKSAAGKPVDRASVVVRFEGNASILRLGNKAKKSWELRTNQEGVARIPPIPQGLILIQVIAKGYQTWAQKIEINEEEKTVEVKLNPPQPQYSEHQ